MPSANYRDGTRFEVNSELYQLCCDAGQPPVVGGSDGGVATGGGGVVTGVAAVYTVTATSSVFSLLQAPAGAGAGAASGGLAGWLSAIAEAVDGWLFWLQMQAVLELAQVICPSAAPPLPLHCPGGLCCRCRHYFCC